MTTRICGTGSRCERHKIDLHGYPCHACAEEYWRRFPKARAVLHRWADTERPVPGRSELAAARKRDLADRAAYDGPHDTTVAPAGAHGPVSRRWNALCTEGCGWSHYWLPSKTAAQEAADKHLADRSAA